MKAKIRKIALLSTLFLLAFNICIGQERDIYFTIKATLLKKDDTPLLNKRFYVIKAKEPNKISCEIHDGNIVNPLVIGMTDKKGRIEIKVDRRDFKADKLFGILVWTGNPPTGYSFVSRRGEILFGMDNETGETDLGKIKAAK